MCRSGCSTVRRRGGGERLARWALNSAPANPGENPGMMRYRRPTKHHKSEDATPLHKYVHHSQFCTWYVVCMSRNTRPLSSIVKCKYLRPPLENVCILNDSAHLSPVACTSHEAASFAVGVYERLHTRSRQQRFRATTCSAWATFLQTFARLSCPCRALGPRFRPRSSHVRHQA
jgi:hypothetical protein